MAAEVNNGSSLATRAIMAIALMVGFYVLALGIAGLLLWIPYAEWEYAHRVTARLALACVASAIAILWALVPRPDRFEPPGPLLDTTSAPRLLRIIDDVARDTGQAPPSEVYLLNQVNAWVTHRGGVMGFGSRRVMGIGLPLLQLLDPAELRAVIAHEFGHYSGGDVALGPWIYKTRGAIGRALAGLQGSWLQAIFNWYGRLFMRLTMAVSRQQEFTADAVAARVAGADVASRALRRVALHGSTYDPYWQADVLPVLKAGYMPPVLEGWREFVTRVESRGAFQAAAHELATGDTAGEFDSHPAMAERIEALERLSTRATAPFELDGPVLGDAEPWVRTLLAYYNGEDAIASLRPVDWKDTGSVVFAAQWEGLVQRFESWFGSITVEQIPTGKDDYARRGESLIDSGQIADKKQRTLAAMRVMSAGLGVALVRAGWEITAYPSEPVLVGRGDVRLDPFATVFSLVEGRESAAEWRSRCDALGISGLALRPSAAVVS